MTAVVLAVIAAYGVHLLYTGAVLRWRGLRVGPARVRGASARRRAPVDQWLAQAGLADVPHRQLAIVLGAVWMVGAVVAFALFGAPLPAAAGGLLAMAFPAAAARGRRTRRREEAADAWPRLIEEIRMQTGSLGRSVPQALFAVGHRGPGEFRPAFAAAEREWLLTTDFARTVALLKHRLADATADVTLETLLVAHEVGGTDLDRRLAALVEDRVQDLQGRKDARAKQAGVCLLRTGSLASRRTRCPSHEARGITVQPVTYAAPRWAASYEAIGRARFAGSRPRSMGSRSSWPTLVSKDAKTNWPSHESWGP